MGKKEETAVTTYEQRLRVVMDAAASLRDAIDALDAAAVAAGRRPGELYRLRALLELVFEDWRRAALPPVDRQKQLVKESEYRLAKSRERLAWAENLPNETENKSESIRRFKESVQLCEKLLRRAKGLPELADDVALGEKLDQLVGRLGSVRLARQALGLPVGPAPEVARPPEP